MLNTPGPTSRGAQRGATCGRRRETPRGGCGVPTGAGEGPVVRPEGSPLHVKPALPDSDAAGAVHLRRVARARGAGLHVGSPAAASTFHHFRHTAITNVYRATKDLFLAQRFARHANPITTVACTPAKRVGTRRSRTSDWLVRCHSDPGQSSSRATSPASSSELNHRGSASSPVLLQ